MERPQQKTDQLIEEFLDGNPRAAELDAMAKALEDRYFAKRAELNQLTPDSTEWDILKDEMKEMKRQIIVLRREEMITRFVEDSVRMTVGAGEMLEGGDEIELRDFEDEFDWKPGRLLDLDEEE